MGSVDRAGAGVAPGDTPGLMNLRIPNPDAFEEVVHDKPVTVL
jgi:hypothetical protein